jgi:hypothetical protein
MLDNDAYWGSVRKWSMAALLKSLQDILQARYTTAQNEAQIQKESDLENEGEKYQIET